MKPIVVSAASAVRAPNAVPSVKAAPPCNRCRREILPKSICFAPWAEHRLSHSRRHPTGVARREESQALCQSRFCGHDFVKALEIKGYVRMQFPRRVPEKM